MQKLTKWLLIVSRIIVGLVFIYSGFVKGIDPLGSTYKMNDYFVAFGADWAMFLSFTLSVLQSIAEFVIGVALLLNIKLKYSSWGALIFMLFYTPITLYSAIANPVHDCGCFGDALVITNWQTFWKNFILLFPTLLIFINRKKSINFLASKEQWLAVSFFTIAISSLTYYSYNHLPIIDFRPYKIGTHIPEGMTIPEGAPADVWESYFLYSKNGEDKEFTVNNLPDSTWIFKDARHELIKKGYEAPIHDFSIVSTDGTEITDIVLSSDNYNFLFIAYNIAKASVTNVDKINRLIDYCYQMGYPLYGLTASADEDVNEFKAKTGIDVEFYNTDEITLKTIIRSNPGLVLLKDGVVIDKWHINDIPEFSAQNSNLIKVLLLKHQSKSVKFLLLSLIMSFSFILSLYLLIRLYYNKA